MTDTTHSPALAVAVAYFEAWTAKDMDRAMTFVDPEIVCDAPAGRLEGADAFRAFMEPFTRICLEARLLGAFGDAETALLIYDTRTVPVERAPGAEHLTVRDGRIVRSTFVFDRLPFEAARRAA